MHRIARRASALTAAVVALLIGLGLVPAQAGSASPAGPAAAPAPWSRTAPGGGGAFNSPFVGPTGAWAVGSDLSGVYLSANQGAAWRAIGAVQGLRATHVSAVVARPDTGDWVVGTNDGIALGAVDGSGMRRVFGPGTSVGALVGTDVPGILYASVHSGWNTSDARVARTDDGGATWRYVSGVLPGNPYVLAIRAHPVDEDAVVAVSGQGRFTDGPRQAWRSEDGGVTWLRIDPRVGDVVDVAYSPADPNRVYLVTGQETNADHYGYDVGVLWRSDDAGGTFRRVRSVATGALWLDRTDPQRVRVIDFRGGDSAIRQSLDGGLTFAVVGRASGWGRGWAAGQSWTYDAGFDGALQTTTAGQADPDRLLWTTGQFVFRSDDGGRTFRPVTSTSVAPGRWLSTGLDNVVPFVVAPSGAAGGLVYAGYWDIGCWRTADGGASWSPCQFDIGDGWQGRGGNVVSLAPDPAAAGSVWGAFADQPRTSSRLAVSTARGAPGSWVYRENGLPAGSLVSGMSIVPDSPVASRTLFVTAAGDVYRTTNAGGLWSKVLACGGCRTTWAGAGGVVYAAGEAGFWRSVDGGATWRSSGPAAFRGTVTGGWWKDGWRGVADLAVDPSQPGRLYAAVPTVGLYGSSDAGATWRLLLADRFARSVAVGRDGRVLLASSSATCCGGFDPASAGVRVSSDRGVTWAAAGTGMTWPMAAWVRVSPVTDRAWAAFVGEGTAVQAP